MANHNALRDEVVSNRIDLVNSLNKLYDEDPQSGILAFQLTLQQLHLNFRGSPESDEPVNEQSEDAK